jgi:hypothetical protein
VRVAVQAIGGQIEIVVPILYKYHGVAAKPLKRLKHTCGLNMAKHGIAEKYCLD